MDSRGGKTVARQACIIVAAFFVVVAFFLPWMHGSNAFDSRTFSGFDFARLIRNFAITAGSPSTVGQVRATAIALYLVPALAVNAVVLDAVGVVNRGWKRPAGLALALSAGYTFAVLGVLLLLSFLPISGLADVVGWPTYGLALTAGGTLVMGSIGVLEMRRWSRPVVNGEAQLKDSQRSRHILSGR
jgi:hypothetical protein